jgi:ABC-type uncharacterized transport system permease subunit
VRAVIAWDAVPVDGELPVQLLAGDAEPFPGLAMQAVWLAIMVIGHRVLWLLGRKQFGAVGG